MVLAHIVEIPSDPIFCGKKMYIRALCGELVDAFDVRATGRCDICQLAWWATANELPIYATRKK